MRRFAVGVVVVLVASFVSAECFAQGRRPYRRDDDDDEPSETCYVLVEKAGYDVTCNIYTSKADIKERAAVVARQNRATRKANKEINAEVKKLQGKIAAKTRQLARAKDPDTKAALQEELAQLKTDFELKKDEKKPYTKLIGPKRFNKLSDADKYIDAVNRAAERARAKAEAKKK